jgi:hypothetical protein
VSNFKATAYSRPSVDSDDARASPRILCKRIYEGQAAVLFALVAHDTRFNSVSQEHDLGKQTTPKKGRE